MLARPTARILAALALACSTPALAQVTTYHLHNDASTTASTKQLRATGPDGPQVVVQTAALQGVAVGEKLLAQFDTATGVPNTAGKIPTGATVTATVWMRKTAALGTMFPRVKVRLNSSTGTALCTATGTTALTTTLTAYTLTCTTTAHVTLTATSRFYVWAGVNLTAGSSAGAFRGELGLEGTLNGAANSRVEIPTALPSPTITSLMPATGGVGTSVTIAGSHFRDQQLGSVVTFSTNRTATVTSWSNTSIVVTVPASTITGAVRVTVAGTASTTATFTVAVPPTLTALSPTSGGVGATITLTGTGFGATPGTSLVRFNGVTATTTSWGATSIAAVVPVGATSGLVTVTVSGQTSAGRAFTVIPPPTLTAVSPTSAIVGGVVTLTGTNFGATQGTSTVRFNGLLATPSAWSATSITTPVPVGATSGPITVVVAAQTSGGLGFTVIPPPTLVSLTPSMGIVGAVVTLTGANFGVSQGTSVVSFGGTVATPTSWSATSITAPVPAGASSGLVTVSVLGQVSDGLAFTVVPPPTLTLLTPSAGAVGAAVTLTGSNFGAAQGTSVVSFNGVLATVTAWSATSITAPVPAGAVSGPVTVTVAGQTSNGAAFTVVPPTTTIAIALTDPFPGTTFNAPASIVVAATATTVGGPIQRVDFYDGPTVIGTATAPPYAMTWAAPAVGEHVLIGAAVDQAGVVTSSTPVLVTIAAAGPTLGTLGAPIANPPGGVYGAPQSVTLRAASGATIHYTTTGAVPTEASPVWSAALSISQTTTVRARAYQAGWTPSAVTTASYTIDTTPPAIVATVDPPPSAMGWHHDSVTVQFACEDFAGIATCSEPTPITGEGSGLIASGTAVNLAGLQASVTVSVKIDRTAPAIQITVPPPSTTTAGSVYLEATVTDAMSGVADATCNGVPAAVSNGTVTCDVQLRPGRNGVVVLVRDWANNSASSGMEVFRAQAPTSLVVSPSRRTLLVGDSLDVVAYDQLGLAVPAVNWTSSDPAVAAVYTDGLGVLTGIAPGTVTLTASDGPHSADLVVSVVGGESLPAGAAKWTLDDTADFAISGIVQGASRDSEDVECYALGLISPTDPALNPEYSSSVTTRSLDARAPWGAGSGQALTTS